MSLLEVAKGLGWSDDIPSEAVPLVHPVFQYILEHIERLQSIQKDHTHMVSRCAQAEQLARQAEEKVGVCEAKILSLQTELECSNELSERANLEIKKLQAEIGNQSAALEQARIGEDKIRSRLARLESENSDLVKTNDRRLSEKAALEADHERLLSLLSKLRSDYNEVESLLEDSRREGTRTKLELSRARSELDSLREQVSWTKTELDKTLVDFTEYKKQRSQEVIQLNGLLSDKVAIVDELDGKNVMLANANSQMSEKIDSLLAELRDTKAELTQAKANFESEMSTTSQSIEVYKSSYNEASLRIVELEGLLQEAADKAAHLEQTIEAEMKRDSRNTHIADVFAENSQSRLELNRLRQENAQLKECLEEVCGEIEARAPLLTQERKENDRLKRELLAITDQVVKLGKSHAEVSEKYETLKMDHEAASKENYSLKSTNCDLLNQIKTLVGNFEVADSDNRQSAFSDTLGESVVVFRNVSELQANNSSLLRRIHDLEYELNVLKNENVSKEQLEWAMKEIEQLNEARTRQTALLESMLNQSQSAQPHSSHRLSISSMKEPTLNDIEDLKSQKRQIEDSLRNQISSMLQEQVQLRASLGKAESQAQYASETLELLKKSLESERLDCNQLRARCRELGEVNMKLSQQIQSATMEALEARQKESQATQLYTNIQNDIEVRKATERNLQKELEELRSDKERLVRLISQLQQSLSDGESNYREMKTRLQQQVDMLEKELQGLRERMTSQLEEAQYGHQQSRRDLETLRVKHEELLDEFSKVKSELIRLQAESGFGTIQQTDQAGIEHYKAAAKASENALAELGRSFEEYRTKVEAEGFSQYEHLQQELESSRQQLAAQSEEVYKCRERIAVLEQLEEEAKSQVQSRLSELQSANAAIESLKADVENEHKMSDDLRKEISRLNGLLKEQLEKEQSLTAKINALETEQANAASQQIEIQQDFINLQRKHDELKQQYDVLLDKLESSLKPSFTFENLNSIDENEQVAQVINYLRQERDTLAREKSFLQDENRRLNGLHDQLKRSFEQLKASVLKNDSDSMVSEKSNEELRDLRERMEALGGYRQTAALLQTQIDSLSVQLDRKTQEINDASSQLEAVKAECRELKASVFAYEGQIKLLTSDRDLWKKRFEDSRNGQAVPERGEDANVKEELDSLKTAYQQLNDEKEALVVEANEKLAMWQERCSKAIERGKHYRTLFEELQEKQKVPAADNTSSEQMAVIAQDLDETRALLNEAISQKEEAIAKLEANEQKVTRLTAMLTKQKQFKKDLETVKAEYEKQVADLNGEIKRLNEQFADVQREHTLHNTALSSQWKSRFEKLQKTLDEYKERFGATGASSVAPEKRQIQQESAVFEKIPKLESVVDSEESYEGENDDDREEEEDDNEEDTGSEEEEEPQSPINMSDDDFAMPDIRGFAKPQPPMSNLAANVDAFANDNKPKSRGTMSINTNH